MTSQKKSSTPDLTPVRDYLMALQDRIASAIQELEPKAQFHEDLLERPRGLSRPRVLEHGQVIDRGGINFSHTRGAQLPAAATTRRPHLTGASFEAVSVSMIFHPVNPYAPTTHANWRCFAATPEDGPACWWFGGGFDLTPYYGFEEDCVHWHRTARDACTPFGNEVYPRFKAWCDDYFFLSHRNEPRGIGGLFYDDYGADESTAEGDFDHAFALTRSIADAFLPAYLPILERRLEMAYGERQKDFQLYRRGRYVEYNLIHDRGTRFGLQSGGRAEAILVSMPPEVRWRYDWQPEPGSEEARLYTDFLRPRDWAGYPSDATPAP